MGLSQYHTTLVHVTPRGRPHTLGCACTMGAYHHAEAPQAQVILPKLHHHAEGLVPRRRSKSRRRVSVYRYRSVTSITKQVCLKNTHVFQTTKPRTPTTVTTGSSELIGRRPAYQSGRPGLYYSMTHPRSNPQIIKSTPQGLQYAHISCI